jgi:hypothetical protein
MRISAFMRRLSLLLALASPVILFAQFQQPTPEELKMTDDPKAPGAAAVYLNVEEITDDYIHFHSFHARIKVLSEKGKELATVEIPYEHNDYRIRNIKARTIHSDGAVILLVGKPEDLMVSKTTDKSHETMQFNRKVFTLPSVEVGSILEYSYDLEYGDHSYSSPHWEIQRPYFVHKAHYAFIPAEEFRGNTSRISSNMFDEHGKMAHSLTGWAILPTGVSVKTDSLGYYSVDLTDIPPQPDEEWMPPIKSILYKVYFYYLSAYDTKDFWITNAKDWSKDVDRFAEPSKSIKEAVAGLVSPADSDLDKAKKLYTAVQALDNTDYSRKKTESEMKQLKINEAKHAQDTWAQKSGTSEDIAMLYLAMLRAAGLTAYAIKVVDRDKGIFDITYLTMSQFDDTLVILSSGGKEIFLDPGEKMCPFQAVNWKHSGTSGIRQSAGAQGVANTPELPYPDNKITRIGDVTLDANGALTGIFRFDLTGQEALYWRQLALTNDETELKKLFEKSLESIFPEGIEAHLDHFNGLSDPNQKLIASIKAQGSYGAATSKRLILPAFFFETRGSHPFVAQEKRLTPVDMHYGDVVTGQVTYHLPDGFSAEGAPQNANISWPQHANLITKSISAPGSITIIRSLARAFTFAKPEEYQDLRAFYQKVAASDQAQLVLTHAPTDKGSQ